MAKTKIEWATHSWNPVTGCTKISEGCQNCYAEKMVKRLAGRYGYPKDEPFRVTVHPDRLKEPSRWKKPRRIFVVSMGDLFHEDVPGYFIHDVMRMVKYNPQHTFLFLTKRPERMSRIWTNIDGVRPENAWLGVTAENQRTADERIPILLQIQAAVRFVSVEPMLSAIDFSDLPEGGAELDGVFCGCESGHGRRHCKTEDMRSLKNQCVDAGVPFFLKQREIDGKVVKMPELDGRTWAEYPKPGGGK